MHNGNISMENNVWTVFIKLCEILLKSIYELPSKQLIIIEIRGLYLDGPFNHIS